MKTKNILITLAVLIILAAGTYFAIQKKSNTSTLNVAETDFTVSDTSTVNKIYLSAKSGKNTLFEKQEDGSWMINKKYTASPDMMNMLLSTLTRMEVKRPVAKAARENVIKQLATSAIKVEVYNNNTLSKVFYVGKETNDKLGSNFLMEGSENPYILHIRGFYGHINGRFEVVVDDWRNKTLFNSTYRSLQSVDVSYPASEEDNFSVKFKDNSFQVEGVNNTDTLKLNQYLSQYQRVSVEQFLTDFPNIKDSLSTITPTAIIKLVDINKDKSNTVKLFAIEGSTDRFLALLEKQDEAVTIQYPIVKSLLAKKDQFIKPSI